PCALLCSSRVSKLAGAPANEVGVLQRRVHHFGQYLDCEICGRALLTADNRPLVANIGLSTAAKVLHRCRCAPHKPEDKRLQRAEGRLRPVAKRNAAIAWIAPRHGQSKSALMLKAKRLARSSYLSFRSAHPR